MLKRVVLPVLWVVIGLVATSALVKIAFFPDVTSDASVPGAELTGGTIAVQRGDVVNSVSLDGNVANRPAEAVKVTAGGEVNHVDVDKGDTVEKGERLFQVRTEQQPTIAAVPTIDPANPSAAPVAPVETGPTYTYTDVFTPTAGKVTSLDVLVGQQVAIGQQVGAVTPAGTLVSAPLSAEQQYRLLDRPAEATVTIDGGPAPFGCGTIEIESVESDTAPQPDPVTTDPMLTDPYALGSGSAGTGQNAATTGRITCQVPEGAKVFAGLAATVDITAGKAEKVLVLPVTAVRGSIGTGTVYRPGENGADPVAEDVELGLTDGKNVEITSGLAEGDEVLEFVPGEKNPDLGQEDLGLGVQTEGTGGN